MAYEVLEVVALPVLNEEGDATGESVRKEPGDSISEEELKKAGQSKEQIASLVESGAIKKGEK